MHHPVRLQIWGVLLAVSLLAASCAAPAGTPVLPTPAPASPVAATSAPASPAPSSPAPASPVPASPAAATAVGSSKPASPGASPSPSVAPPTAPASPVAAPPKDSPPALDPNQLFLTVVDANAAYARRDLPAALRLYEQAAEANLPAGTGPPGQDLRAFARFRYLVASTVAGQEDQARAVLETARAEDAATPFPPLGLAFWDIYSMTADPAVACRRVNDLVAEEPGAVARSLSSWGSGNSAVSPEQVCQLPGS